MPVIILLHGYGSDERDLFELRNSLPKDFLIVSARAPYALPGGGYQWYEFTTINGQHDGKADQLANSRKLIGDFIGQIVERYHADPKQVYVAGFSQGAIMSYQVGLTVPGKIKGIGVLSGMIFESLKPIVAQGEDLKRLRIFISHGTADNRIAYSDGKAAEAYVESLGLHPRFHAYEGMGHSISNEVMKDFVQWLGK